MNACSWCGNSEFEIGFFEDQGRGSTGYLGWTQGPFERAPFGGVKRAGRNRYAVDAQRCTQCGHLELFATESNDGLGY